MQNLQWQKYSMGDGDLIRLALLDSFPVRGGAVRYVKEEVAGRIRGRVDRSPGTTPPRRAASSPVAGQGACCLGGFDPPTPTEGPSCSAHALSIGEIALPCTLPIRRSGSRAGRRSP